MRGRAGLILAIVGAIVFNLLVFFFLVNPRRGELAQIRLDIENERARTVQLQAELDRLQALQERAPQLQAQLARIREFVPLRPEVPNLIFQIQQAANRAGIDFVQITPELPDAPPEGALVAEVRMAIGAKGGYFAIQDFVRRLYDLDRALRIDNFTLSAEETDQQVRLNLASFARVFFELPEGAGGTTTTTTTTAPTTTVPAATPAPTP